MKPLSTNDITRIAKMQLAAKGVYCWRNNQVKVPGRRFNGEKGVSDLIGINASGQFVACEVKGEGDSLSDDQKAFLRRIKDAGGEALVACEGHGGNVELVDYDVYVDLMGRKWQPEEIGQSR